jgi:hypothetical protein
MKKMYTIIIIVILFLTIVLTGCQDLAPKATKGKVVVTVVASAFLVQSMSNDTPVGGQTIDILITKTGGKDFEYSIATDDGGYVQCPAVVYNLYENQDISVKYYAPTYAHIDGLSFSSAYDSEKEETVQEKTLGPSANTIS